MSELALSNVINISVSAAPVGLGRFNTSNLALFTHDVPGSERIVKIHCLCFLDLVLQVYTDVEAIWNS